jgi:Carboxypeptidase regulatory-like domain
VSNISNMNSNGTNNNTGELWVFSPTYQRGCYIEGWVRNTSGANINGAFVELVGTNTNESSNTLGEYKMGRQQSGTFTLKVTKAGYQTFTQSITIANGVLSNINVTLQAIAAPVELIRFEAKADKKTASLLWETGAELNAKGFGVQHSRDLAEWREIAFVEARGDGSSYAHKVDNLAGGTHYFRLNQLDQDGKNSYSEAKRVEIAASGIVAEVRPSLIKDRATLHLELERNASVSLSIIDATGADQGKFTHEVSERNADIPLDFTRLPSGLYFVEIQIGLERFLRRIIIE